MHTLPRFRLLSLGAGVQSSALLILAAQGQLPDLSGAIFSDTGWEPQAVYDHLDRLEREIAAPAGIPIYRVSAGNIRNDALDPEHRFASMPLYVKGPCDLCDGEGRVLSFVTGPAARQAAWPWVRRLARWRNLTVDELGGAGPWTGSCPKCEGSGQQDGMARRQCTSEYKLKPIKTKVRELLGYPHPTPVPKGVFVEQWIGISTDERDRAIDKDTGELKAGDTRYSRNRYPLLELGMSRDHCRALLATAGFESTPKSACIGCPFASNARWRDLRDNHPQEFDDAVQFDAAIRAGSARANAAGSPLRGEAFLHRSRLPLADAPIDRVTFNEWAARQGDLLHEITIAEFEESLSLDAVGGCSPFGCAGDVTVEASCA